MNFIHISDIHLGYYQYALEERFRDYAISFKNVVKYAIDHKAEFILISGDLFDKHNINAATYLQAYKILSHLKEKSPSTMVYVIEGNHDKAHYSDKYSWLQNLDAQGLLKLIKIKNKENIELMGDYVELENIRIFGIKYIGSSTESIIEKIADEIKKVNSLYGKKYTILMMHFGLSGQIRHEISGEVPYNSVFNLKGVVDYLALGHYHTKYEVDDWIFNPGSLEMTSISEYGDNKGFYHVRDRGIKHIQVMTRPVRHIKLDISGISTPELLYSSLDTRFKREPNIQQDGLIHITLYGELNFPKSEINIKLVKSMAKEEFSCLYCDVKINNTNSKYVIDGNETKGLSKEQIEFKVFSDRIKLDGRYKNNVDNIVKTMIEVKNMAYAKINENEIQSELRQCFKKVNG